MKILSRIVLAALLTSVGATAEEAAPPLSDANIAAIVLAANQVDVEAGELALDRSTNPDVRALAQQMVTDHTAANQAAGELAGRLGLTPVPNDVSRQLEEGGRENRARLSTLEGDEFDTAYVSHEVAYHKAVLDAIDKVLLPGASHRELRALIEQVRPVIAAHLHHAESLLEKVE